jgi:hypothetical protein
MVEYSFIGSLFYEEEIKIMKTIPLSCTNQEDTLIWRGTNNGVFR